MLEPTPCRSVSALLVACVVWIAGCGGSETSPQEKGRVEKRAGEDHGANAEEARSPAEATDERFATLLASARRLHEEGLVEEARQRLDAILQDTALPVEKRDEALLWWKGAERKRLEEEREQERAAARAMLESARTLAEAGREGEAERILSRILSEGRADVATEAEAEALHATLRSGSEARSETVFDDFDERLVRGTWYRFTPGEPTLAARFLPGGGIEFVERESRFTEWEFAGGVVTLVADNGGTMRFRVVHEDVLVPVAGSKYRHVWLSP